MYLRLWGIKIYKCDLQKLLLGSTFIILDLYFKCNGTMWKVAPSIKQFKAIRMQRHLCWWTWFVLDILAWKLKQRNITIPLPVRSSTSPSQVSRYIEIWRLPKYWTKHNTEGSGICRFPVAFSSSPWHRSRNSAVTQCATESLLHQMTSGKTASVFDTLVTEGSWKLTQWYQRCT